MRTIQFSLRYRDCEAGFYDTGIAPWEKNLDHTRFHGDYLELTIKDVERRVMDIPNYGMKPMLRFIGSLHHSLLVDNVHTPFVFSTMAMGVIKVVTFNPCGFTGNRLSVRATRFSTKTFNWYWPIFKSMETGKVWAPNKR